MNQYSLVGAPNGLTIDANTGVISGAAGMSVGFYSFSVRVEDENGVFLKDCDTSLTITDNEVIVDCEDANVSCEDCIEKHLDDTYHVSLNDVSQLVDQAITYPPVPRADCCDDLVEHESDCGNVYVWADRDGNGIVDKNTTDKHHAYEGELPDPDEAVIKPVYDPVTGSQLPFKPNNVYAGPIDSETGKMSCITHIGSCGEWFAICATGQSAIVPDGFVKCCLYDEDTIPDYPIYYSSEDSAWTINGVVYQLPDCETEIESGCANWVGRWISTINANLGTADLTTGISLPDLAVLSNIATQVPTGFGCDGYLSPNSTGGNLYMVDHGLWSGNNGDIKVSDVVKMTLCFTLTPGLNSLGVGINDVYGDLTVANDESLAWMPVTDVRPPGGAIFVNNGNYVDIQSNDLGGVWQIDFTVDPQAVNSNTLSTIFFGVDTETIVNYFLKVEYGGSEICGAINDATQLADLLTQADPRGFTWFAEGDNVCSFVPEGFCSG